MDASPLTTVAALRHYGLQLQQQLSALNPADPASWPALPRYLLLAGVSVLIVGVIWLFFIGPGRDQLLEEQASEERLRADYSRKLPQAVHLTALRAQREQVQQQVQQLEKQLPGKSEMDALLSDINQAGLSRNLHFELFRPGQVTVKPYYAELPIALKVQGRYHDIGAFAADIARLARIVTLNNLVITPGRDGQLTLEATAKTFRYLDPEEVAHQRKTPAAGGSP